MRRIAAKSKSECKSLYMNSANSARGIRTVSTPVMLGTLSVRMDRLGQEKGTEASLSDGDADSRVIIGGIVVFHGERISPLGKHLLIRSKLQKLLY